MTEHRPLATTLQALIDEEQQRTANARNRLGSFVPLAENAIGVLNTFVVSIDRDHFMAAALMLAIQKSVTLAFLSYIRGHIAQAEFNCRQVIEFCSLTAYLIAHPDEDVTKGQDDAQGGFKQPKAFSVKAYKWLDNKYPHHSAQLKELKSSINDTASHASVYLTHFTFDWETGGYDAEQFRGSFFDNVDDGVSQLYLMSFARLMLIVMDTIRLVSETHGGFKLRDDTMAQLTQLDCDTRAHRLALGKKMKLL